MSHINWRTKIGMLSLVSGTARAVPHPTGHHAASSTSLPEGWFCDEVGYISETADAARMRMLAAQKQTP